MSSQSVFKVGIVLRRRSPPQYSIWVFNVWTISYFLLRRILYFHQEFVEGDEAKSFITSQLNLAIEANAELKVPGNLTNKFLSRFLFPSPELSCAGR